MQQPGVERSKDVAAPELASDAREAVAVLAGPQTLPVPGGAPLPERRRCREHDGVELALVTGGLDVGDGVVVLGRRERGQRRQTERDAGRDGGEQSEAGKAGVVAGWCCTGHGAAI